MTAALPRAQKALRFMRQEVDDGSLAAAAMWAQVFLAEVAVIRTAHGGESVYETSDDGNPTPGGNA